MPEVGMNVNGTKNFTLHGVIEAFLLTLACRIFLLMNEPIVWKQYAMNARVCDSPKLLNLMLSQIVTILESTPGDTANTGDVWLVFASRLKVWN